MTRGNTRNLAVSESRQKRQHTLTYASIGSSIGLTGGATPRRVVTSEQSE